MEFFEKYTGTIEIVRENNLSKVDFPLMPQVETLNNTNISDWLEDMPMGKPKSKIGDFVDNLPGFSERLKIISFAGRGIKYAKIINISLAIYEWTIFFLVISFNKVVNSSQFSHSMFLPQAIWHMGRCQLRYFISH